MSLRLSGLGATRFLNSLSSSTRGSTVRMCQAYRQITTLEFYEQNKKEYYYLLNKDGNDIHAEINEKWNPKPQEFAPEVPIFTAEWPEGHEEALQKDIQAQLGFSETSAKQLVGGMRHGLCSESLDEVVPLVRRLRELEELFPGFQVETAVATNPRLLKFSPGRLYWSMLTFQDMLPVAEVGLLMQSVGHFIAENPLRCARNVHALATEMAAQLGAKLDFSALRQDSRFLRLPNGEESLRERIEALTVIFGAPAAAEALQRNLNLLRLDPKEVNRQAIEIRQQFPEEAKDNHIFVADTLCKNALPSQ